MSHALDRVLDRLAVNPRDDAAWAQLRPAFLDFARLCYPREMASQSSFAEDVVDFTYDRIVRTLLSGQGSLGRPGERSPYVKQMLVNRSRDCWRRRNAFGGARREVEPSDERPAPVEDAPDGAPLVEQRLVEAAVSQELRGVLEVLRQRARDARQTRYREDFDASWAAWVRFCGAGLTVEAWVVAEAEARGETIFGDALRRERERVQRQFSRLLDALRGAAEELSEADRALLGGLFRGSRAE
jgi:DNA-directed RNA polymerase specialized sigma24 family protein